MSREKRQRETMVRLVLSPEGELLVDYRARLSGRGAWVEPSRVAVEQLQEKPGLLYRALKIRPDTTGLLEKVREANLRAVLDALTLCARAGALAAGKDGVRAAIRSDRALAVLLASDISPRLKADLERRCGPIPCVTFALDREALGTTVGKGLRAALAVLAGKPGRHMLRELHRYQALS